MAKKKKTKKPNIKFINKLKAQLRDRPKTYDQDEYKPCDEHLCQSPVCVAGHAYLLAGHSVQELIDAESDEICTVAMEAMGIPNEFADTLFSTVEEWPVAFSYDEDAPPRKRVEKACKYLDVIVEAMEVQRKHPLVAKLLHASF